MRLYGYVAECPEAAALFRGLPRYTHPTRGRPRHDGHVPRAVRVKTKKATKPPRQPRGTRNQARLQEMIAFREMGETLEQIAGRFGITRERTRQILTRHNNGKALTRPADADPIAIVRALRLPTTTTVDAIVRITGYSPIHVNDCLRVLGLTPATKRLFRWRISRITTKQRDERRAEAIAAVQAFTARAGRIPTGWEMGTHGATHAVSELPDANTCVRLFGDMAAFWKACGLTPRPLGGPGHLGPRKKITVCRRGHPLEGTNVQVWTSAEGVEHRSCRACRKLLRSRKP